MTAHIPVSIDEIEAHATKLAGCGEALVHVDLTVDPGESWRTPTRVAVNLVLTNAEVLTGQTHTLIIVNLTVSPYRIRDNIIIQIQ